MLFNSIEFAFFLPIVFLLYWFVFNRSLRWQNIFIVIVSYFFYGLWDWKFLLLIAFTTITSFLSGLLIENARKRQGSQIKQKLYLVINIVINLLILGFFKYFNFFVEQFVELFAMFNINLHPRTLSIILPVGISFYTFQSLSYSIDVYRHKIEPTHDIASFFAFVSFFPQLVAGPIERATNFLPQFYKSRSFDYNEAVIGCRMILWGMFKKVVIADTCALYVDSVWGNIAGHNSCTLLIAAILFAFQIYGDFSGYSDIAIGTAKLFGFSLMRNFNIPYFSRDIAEFWRRWHISLNRWFVDYIYIPLGGSREGKWKSFRNTLIIFTICGLWHGANWTFVIWGLYHAVWFLPLLLLEKNTTNKGSVVAENSVLPSVKELIQMILTFIIAVVGWIIFRAENMHQAWDFFSSIFTTSIISVPGNLSILIQLVFYIPVMLIVEWMDRKENYSLTLKSIHTPWIRASIYVVLIFITIFNFRQGQAFIYFQF